MTRAIRVTGAGVVCALGASVRAALDPAAAAPAPRDGLILAPFDPRDLPNGIGRRLGRQPALALGAVLDALGGRTPDPGAALVLGTAHGAMSETIDFIGGAARHGPAGASPLLFAGSLHNAMAGAIGRALGVRGPAIVVSDGDASFEAALVVAAAMIRSGSARQVIVGASDALHPVFADGLRVMSLVPRDGDAAYPVSEGGGALVLEAGVPDAGGVSISHATIGGVRAAPRRVSSMAWLTSGERRSVARHRDAARRFVSGAPEPSFPAARLGAFGSLGAVAAALEAARRRALANDPAGVSVLVQAPYRASAAVTVLSGFGAA